jgi:hypothetical protein
MKITNKYLLDYIANRPELSGFEIIDRAPELSGFNRLSFGHKSFQGFHLCIQCGESQEAIARNLKSFEADPHEPEDSLMLHGK